MAEAIRLQLDEAPEVTRVQELARQAVQTLRAAQEHVHREATSLHAERERLEGERKRLSQGESDLVQQRSEFESQLADIVNLSADLERRTAALEASRKKIEDDACVLSNKEEEVCALGARLTNQERLQTAAAKTLAEREANLAQTERNLQATIRDLEPRRQTLERREQELLARTSELETQASELVETRNLLAELQAQLTRDHQEVDTQRDELLQRLAVVARPPPASFPPETVVAQAEKPVVAHPPVRGPKPAVAQAADQFRKLRRDAKRKAVGV